MIDPDGLTRTQETPLDLTDSGVCARSDGYLEFAQSPFKTLEDKTFTIYYDPGDLNHRKIVESMNETVPPGSEYYWRMVAPDGTVRWCCRAWVLMDHQQLPRDTPEQLEFTLKFTGQPTHIHSQVL
jgi:hypothetical protein